MVLSQQLFRFQSFFTQFTPLRFRIAGRVWFGGAQETRELRATIESVLSKWSIFSNLPTFLDLNSRFKHTQLLFFVRILIVQQSIFKHWNSTFPRMY